MRDFALHQAEFSGSLPNGGFLLRLWHNWMARRAVASLDRLDDFLLHDIGVSRDDVHRAARAPLSENAILVLDDLSRHGQRPLTLPQARAITVDTVSPIRPN